MNHCEILEFLAKHNQKDLLDTINALSNKDRAALLAEVEKYKKVYQGGPQTEELKDLPPLQNCEKVAANYKLAGIECIKRQEVGCMVFAAGEGSRFNSNKAKGLFCLEKNNSLFSHLCKWVLAYERAFGVKIPLLFLVSSKNKKEIQDHFEQNRFFGLDPRRTTFLEQENYPFFDEKHQWILNSDNTIKSAPNGNGGFLEVFEKSNAMRFLIDQNIKYLQVFFIDNPLLDPLDPSLLGFLIKKKLDTAIHVFERDDPNEKVGVIYKTDNGHFVIDYTQLSKSVFTKIENNRLFYPYANAGHFCINVNALASLIQKKVKLPYHWVWKKIADKVWGWKAEKFAFDVFSYLSCQALCYDKKLTFAPLKTMQDVKNVRCCLNQKKQMIYKKAYKENLPSNYSLTIEDIVSYLKKEST